MKIFKNPEFLKQNEFILIHTRNKMEDKLLSLYKETFLEAITKENYMVNINGVYFHRFILEMYSEYFRINQNIFSIFSNVKTELIEQLKNVVYYQPFLKDTQGDTQDMDTQFLIDLYFLLDMILADTKTLKTVKKSIKYKKDNLALRFFGIIEDFNAVSFLIKRAQVQTQTHSETLNYDIFLENCFKPHFLGKLIIYNVLPLDVIERLKLCMQDSHTYVRACLLYNSGELIHARMLFQILANGESSFGKICKYSRNYLAYMISEGQGGYKDEREARKMFKENWEKYGLPESLYNYAHMVYHKEGEEGGNEVINEKDSKTLSKNLFQICWERYECADSFYMLNVKFYDKFLTCIENLKQNWEENVNEESYKFLKKFGFVS